MVGIHQTNKTQVYLLIAVKTPIFNKLTQAFEFFHGEAIKITSLVFLKYAFYYVLLTPDPHAKRQDH